MSVPIEQDQVYPEGAAPARSGQPAAQNRGRFPPGVSGNPGGRPKAEVEDASLMPPLLRDMRKVWKSDGKAGKDPLRTLYREQFERFLDRLTRLEHAYLAAAAKSRSAHLASRADADLDEEEVYDEGSTRVLALLEEQIAKFGGVSSEGARPKS